MHQRLACRCDGIQPIRALSHSAMETNSFKASPGLKFLPSLQTAVGLHPFCCDTIVGRQDVSSETFPARVRRRPELLIALLEARVANLTTRKKPVGARRHLPTRWFHFSPPTRLPPPPSTAQENVFCGTKSNANLQRTVFH